MVARARRIQRVLVVDDDEIELRAFARGARGDLDVVTAAEPEEAMAIAATATPDLSIVDLRLENSSGLDVVASLRAEHPLMPIALISGFSTTQAAITTTAMALRAGADVVVEKPVTCRDIVVRLEEEWRLVGTAPLPSAKRLELDRVLAAARRHRGNITITADALGIARQSLQRKLRKHRPTE